MSTIAAWRRPDRRSRGHAPRLWASDPLRAPRSRPAIRSPTRPGSRRHRDACAGRARRSPTIWSSCSSPAAHPPIGSRPPWASRSAKSRPSPARCSRPARRSPRSIRCASICRASRAGGWRERAAPARLVAVGISDVPGDDPAVIGSGPTVPDPTTLADARAIVARHRLDVLRCRDARPRRPGERNPQARRPGLCRNVVSRWRPGRRTRFAPRRLRCARPATTACSWARSIEGEAREVAAEHARLARELQAQGRRAVILSGGELTVTLRGGGRGGPNQEYALALAIGARRHGRGGGAGRRHRRHRWGQRQPDDPAGALIDAEHACRGRVRSASIRPTFLMTTIRPNSLPSSATCSSRGRPSPTSMISGPSSLTARRASRDIRPRRGTMQCGHDDTSTGKDGNSRLPAVGPRRSSPAPARPGVCWRCRVRRPPISASATITSSRVGIAVGYKDNEGWTTEGWWNLSAALLRDAAARHSGRTLLLHLCDRLRPRRRMVGPGLHVHAREGVHHQGHRGLPRARL